MRLEYSRDLSIQYDNRPFDLRITVSDSCPMGLLEYASDHPEHKGWIERADDSAFYSFAGFLGALKIIDQILTGWLNSETDTATLRTNLERLRMQFAQAVEIRNSVRKVYLDNAYKLAVKKKSDSAYDYWSQLLELGIKVPPPHELRKAHWENFRDNDQIAELDNCLSVGSVESAMLKAYARFGYANTDLITDLNQIVSRHDSASTAKLSRMLYEVEKLCEGAVETGLEAPDVASWVLEVLKAFVADQDWRLYDYYYRVPDEYEY